METTTTIPGRVLSNVKGHVVLRDAIAHLTNVSFDVPGASAVVSGTYNLKSQKVDLQGPVRLDASALAGHYGGEIVFAEDCSAAGP